MFSQYPLLVIFGMKNRVELKLFGFVRDFSTLLKRLVIIMV